MLKWSRHSAERIAASAFILLSIVLLAESVHYGLFQAGRPGPGLFPGMVSAALLAVSCAWWIIGAGPGDDVAMPAPHERDARIARADKTTSPSPELSQSGSEEEPIDFAGMKRIAAVVAWSAIPLLLLEPLGYLISMTLYVSGLLMFLGRVRPWTSVIGTAAGVVITAYGADALGVVLPDPLHLLEILGL